MYFYIFDIHDIPTSQICCPVVVVARHLSGWAVTVKSRRGTIKVTFQNDMYLLLSVAKRENALASSKA